MTALEFLELDNAGITDAGLVHLKQMVGLKQLHLRTSRATAAGLADLSGMTGLSVLNLALTGIDDLAPIRHLTGLNRAMSLPRVQFTIRTGMSGNVGLMIGPNPGGPTGFVRMGPQRNGAGPFSASGMGLDLDGIIDRKIDIE